MGNVKMAIIGHAEKACNIASESSKDLTASILMLMGAFQSATGLDAFEVPGTIYVDPSNSSTNEDHIVTIGPSEEDESEDIVAFVEGDEDYEQPIDELPLDTRIELAQALIKRLVKN